MLPQAERQRRLKEARAGCWRAGERRRRSAAAEEAASCASATRFPLATALDNELMADDAQRRSSGAGCKRSLQTVPWNAALGVAVKQTVVLVVAEVDVLTPTPASTRRRA